MSKGSLYQLPSAQATVNAAQLSGLVEFLVTHPELVMPVPDARALLTSRAVTNTAVAALAVRAVELDKDRVVACVRLPTHTPHPEVLTYRHMCFDSVQMAAVNPALSQALASLPAYRERCVLNVTPYLTSLGEVTDLTLFQGLVARDLLARSYFRSEQSWLAPSLIQYLSRVYSMSLAAPAAAMFHLSPLESSLLTAVMALYFLQRCTRWDQAEALLISGARGLGLGLSPQQLTDLLRVIRAELGGAASMSFDDMCRLGGTLTAPRVDLSRRLLYQRFASYGTDLQTLAIALEYPPYWAYLVLLALSGKRLGGLPDAMKRNGTWRDGATFAADLARSSGFFPTVA